MATTPKRSVGLGTKLQNLKAGADKNFTGKATLTFGGASWTPSTLDTKLDSMIQPFTAETAAVSAAKVARTAAKAGEAEAVEFANGLTAAVRSYFGPKNPILLDFGIALAKDRTPSTGAENVAKAAKAAHTKQLRGTLTAKQKAALTSTAAVTVSAALTVPATVPESATSTPVASPAPVANTAVHPASPAAPAAGSGS